MLWIIVANVKGIKRWKLNRKIKTIKPKIKLAIKPKIIQSDKTNEQIRKIIDTKNNLTFPESKSFWKLTSKLDKEIQKNRNYLIKKLLKTKKMNMHTFEVKNKLIFSDPSYEKSSDLSKKFKAKPGTWLVFYHRYFYSRS